MTEEQRSKLGIYRLLSKNNSTAEEASVFISADRLKLELFKLHYNDGGANPDSTSHIIEAVRRSEEVLDLFATGA